MKILIYGAGAVGTVFGGFLAKSEEEVFLFGREAQMSAIKDGGLHLEGLWGSHHIRNLTCYSNNIHLREDHLGTFDLVLLTVKAYDTVSAMADLRNIAGANTLVLSLQNGIGNIETISKTIGEANTIGGRIIFGAETIKPGTVRVNVSADDVVIGRISTKTPMTRIDEIANLLSYSGIKTRTTEEIDKFIWGKLMYNCSVNALASILSVSYGELLESEYTKNIMRQIISEVYVVAAAKGIQLDPSTKDEYLKILFNKLIPLTSSHRCSMNEDIQKARRTEIDYLNGMINRMGKDLSIPTPFNQMITELVKFKEKKQSKAK